MATAAPIAARRQTPSRPHLAEVPDLAWASGEWVEVERVRLAPVVDLDDYRSPQGEAAGDVARGRLVTAFVAVATALLLALTAGGRLADAGPVDGAAGEAVVAPGETLWDVAVTHAPADVDPRAYLARIRELNDLPSATVPAWTVVLLPHG